MKIVYYSLRQEEAKALEEFQKEHPDYQIEIFKEALKEANMQALEDADALCVSQVLELTEAVYASLGKSPVKVMATRSAGYDMYDLERIKSLGIRFCNVPSYSPSSIAEFAFTGALAINRHLSQFVSRAKQGDFRWNPELISTQLKDRVVGIAGTGRIGREAAKLFKAIGCKILGYDIYPSDEAKQYLTYVDEFREFLSQVDLLSLHMPATKENQHLLNAQTLALMPKGAMLVNTARGALVDTEALLEALDSGHLAGAAIDCYEFEGSFITKQVAADKLDANVQRLLAHEKVIYTPHIAYYTDDAVKSLVQGALDGIVCLLEGGDCPSEIKL